MGNIDNFLSIVEARVNVILATRKMTSRAVLTCDITKEYYGLPPDYNGLRDIEISDLVTGMSRITPGYLNPEQMNNQSSYGGHKIYYTILVDQVQITPKQDNSKQIEIAYYRNIPPLDSANPNNWLGDVNPDCYVFGLLVEISAFVKDMEAAKMWASRFKEATDNIQDNSDKDTWSGTPLQIRVG